ncbi:MAG TPA: Rne/Rng family ribonuclease [Trebonia sp.]
MLDSELNKHQTDDNETPRQGANGAASSTQVSGAEVDTAPVPPAPAVPAVLFQAPQVLFQPPQAYPPPGGGRGAGSTGPASGSGPAGGTGASGGTGAGGGAGAGEAPDDEAAPNAPASSTGTGRSRRGATGGRATRGRGTRDRDRDRDLADGDAADADDAALAPDDAAEADAAPMADDAEEAAGSRRRRRSSRDRRVRGRVDAASPADAAALDSDDAADGEQDSEDGEQDSDDDTDVTLPGGLSASRRRRRKRRRGSGDVDVIAPDDPPDTVVHVREPHNLADDVRSVKGSTRLEAKKQRRREGRESGRRRPPVVTESEFLARRESVERTMVVRQRGDRTQIAVLEDGVLVEHYVNRTTHQSYVGNVYLGKVQNVLPSMEAAFVDIGKGRNAVLYAGEVNFDASGLEGQPKRIESALKPGQSVIVQVTKDPVGHKGARLTSQVSLPGRYLVYVPGASMTGISRKLPDTERNRLKHILKKVTPDNAGVIVRTAAEGAAEAELERDITRLAAQWESIEKKAKTATAPALLYGEPDLTVRVIRDVFNEDFSTLLVSGDDGWDVIDEYVRYVAPHLAERVERWGPENIAGGAATGADDVFAAYRIDEQLAKALERKVWLPSGGSLVIDRTEAMTVIDVNTGKFTGQGGNLEETVTRNNLEAAEEIVRQLRLRDVGGIVVIDFIDMVLESNRELVLRRLLECLARDRTKHQVAEVTSLGLVQMTRKRVGAGLLEAFSEPCEHCNGRGVMVHFEPVELTGQHPHRRNGNGNNGQAYGGGSGSDHNGRRESGAGQGASSGPAVTVVDSPLDSLGDSADSADSGRSGHGSRRNRRDRDRGSRHGSPSVAHAIAGMASAALAGTTSSEDFYSADLGSAIDETVAADSRSEGGTPAEAVSGQAPGVDGAAEPATDIPPAPRGRRTRSGSATVRRVTTSDEPVATVVAVPPVEAEPASPAEPPAEEAPADEPVAEVTVADEPVADEPVAAELVAEVAPQEPGTGEMAVLEADAAPAAEAVSEAGEVTEPAESPASEVPAAEVPAEASIADFGNAAAPAVEEAPADEPAVDVTVADEPVADEAEVPVGAEASSEAEAVEPLNDDHQEEGTGFPFEARNE